MCVGRGCYDKISEFQRQKPLPYFLYGDMHSDLRSYARQDITRAHIALIRSKISGVGRHGRGLPVTVSGQEGLNARYMAVTLEMKVRLISNV